MPEKIQCTLREVSDDTVFELQNITCEKDEDIVNQWNCSVTADEEMMSKAVIEPIDRDDLCLRAIRKFPTVPKPYNVDEMEIEPEKGSQIKCELAESNIYNGDIESAVKSSFVCRAGMHQSNKGEWWCYPREGYPQAIVRLQMRVTADMPPEVVELNQSLRVYTKGGLKDRKGNITKSRWGTCKAVMELGDVVFRRRISRMPFRIRQILAGELKAEVK
jgi:hypothetical protein